MCSMATNTPPIESFGNISPIRGVKIRAPQTTYIVTGVDIKARAFEFVAGNTGIRGPVVRFPGVQGMRTSGRRVDFRGRSRSGGTSCFAHLPLKTPKSTIRRASTSSTEEKPHSVKERTSSERGTTSPLASIPEAKEPKREKTSFPGDTESSDSILEKPKKTRRRRKRNASAKQEEGKERVTSPRTQQEERPAPLEENKNSARPSEGKRHADSAGHSPRTSREEQALKRTPPDGEGEQKQKTRRRRRPRRKPQASSSSSEENRSAEKPDRTTVDATSKG